MEPLNKNRFGNNTQWKYDKSGNWIKCLRYCCVSNKLFLLFLFSLTKSSKNARLWETLITPFISCKTFYINRKSFSAIFILKLTNQFVITLNLKYIIFLFSYLISLYLTSSSWKAQHFPSPSENTGIRLHNPGKICVNTKYVFFKTVIFGMWHLAKIWI